MGVGSRRVKIGLQRNQDMPRPTKAFRRQKINAAIAFKRGDKKEAYELWEKASASLKEYRSKKAVRHAAKPEEAEGGESKGEAKTE